MIGEQAIAKKGDYMQAERLLDAKRYFFPSSKLIINEKVKPISSNF